MNPSFPKENFSLLSIEKKAKIMQDLREEIDKQKSQFSLNEAQINNIQNKNTYTYNPNDIKNLNLNETENNEENTEQEEEEHMEILNNAKNVLNQIQDDINNITKAYGIQNINYENKNENVNYIYDDNDNNSNESKEISEDESNTEEEKNNNEQINQYEKEDENEINDNNNDNIIHNQNKNASIQFNQINNQYNTGNVNNISEVNNNLNKINYSKYNFDNPLGYDNELMKNNIKNYSYNNYGYNQTKNKINHNQNNNYNSALTNKEKPITKKNKKINNSKKKSNISFDEILTAKNKEKFNSMKKELENKFAQDHPFKPKINKNYQPTKLITETEQERYIRLSRPKIFDLNEKRRKKDLAELKKISENNTVKPCYKVNPTDVSNRLYNLSRELKIKKDKIKQTYEQSQNKEYSFTPEINTYSKLLMDKYEQKPIYERNEDFTKNKTNNIIKMRQEIEKEQKERCKPKINPNSRKMVQMQRNYGEYYEYEDVYDRLYKENINKDTKNLGNRDLKECTFTPKLNPVSNLLVSNNGQNYIRDNNINNINNNNIEENEAYNDNINDFLERQKKYEDLKKKKLEKNKESNKDYTFKPEINSNSDLLVKCNPERLLEKNIDKYSRLYQDAERIKQKKEKMQYELDNKYNFTPQINELSKYIGRKPGIDELNSIPGKISKNQKEEEEYDFMPQINQNAKYKNIQSNYKNDQGILDRINEEMEIKNKKIENMQKIKENIDISKYNFTPEINKTMPDFENKNNKPMYMKGMARYLNQMEKARQAKRDKEQREKEVFITGENWNKNNGITVPKPFKLSYQNNIRKEFNKERERNEENKESLYRMKNNENKNREIIRKLINGN